MPQMFPLLWLYLMAASAFALFISMSIIHFILKPNLSNIDMKTIKTEHNWKW